MKNQSTAALGLSEVVLKTRQYEKVRDWYSTALDVKPLLETRLLPRGPGSPERICFLRLRSEFPFTQTLAIFEVAQLGEPTQTTPGLHHFQVQLGFVEPLFDRYELLRAHGTLPMRSANHGPSTSFYYQDPDQNLLELSGQNYETEAERDAFIQSEAFRRNPGGIDVDPEEYVGRFRQGTSIRILRKIPVDA